MKKNKKILYLGLATICPLIIGFTTLSMIFFNKNTKLKEIKTKEIEANEEKNNYEYVVKEIDGKIGVFENGKNVPIETLEKEVEYLPEYDKKILKDGIFVENNQELNKILEDYED